MSVWCATHSASPRKHAHPAPTSAARFSVTLGDGQEDRIINALWTSGDIEAAISIDLATLRQMITLGETYKPGATLRGGAA